MEEKNHAILGEHLEPVAGGAIKYTVTKTRTGLHACKFVRVRASPYAALQVCIALLLFIKNWQN